MSGGGPDGQDMAAARDDLELSAQGRFAFLLTERGFAKGPTEHGAAATSYYYKDRPMVARVGVQVLLDFRDGSVDALLVRFREGKLPKPAASADGGEHVRRPVALVLRDVLRVRDEQLDRVFELARAKRPWPAQLADELLALYSGLVARHIAATLQQPIDVLFPPRGRARP